MKRLLSLILGMVALLMLGGCAIDKYDRMMSMEPDERPSIVTDDFRENHYVQPCFIVTTMCWEKFAHPGDQYMGPIGLVVLWGHFLADTSCSLCADIVTMPWQLLRYRRFTSDGDAVSRSAIVPELLRRLKHDQESNGCISGIGESERGLVNTSLTVLALLHRGDLPGHNTEFSEMCGKGVDYLVSCADTSGATIRLKGEEAEIAEKCAARVAEEVASVGSDAEIDEKTAGKLRWAVMTLQDSKDARLQVANLDKCLERAKSILARYGKGDNGYYDVWELWRKVYIDGTADGGEWATLCAAKREAVRKSIYVCGTEQDKEGKWRWMSTLRPCEGGIAASGLGDNADIALAVLQLTWPISNRCPPKSASGRKDE